MTSRKIEKLVRKASKGDDNAFKELCYMKSQSLLYNAYSILKDHHLAEDAVQESYIKMYKYIGTLKNPAVFDSWLMKIVKNECFSILEKKGKVIEDLYLDEGYEKIAEENEDFLPHEFYENEELRCLLIEVINELPTKKRLAVNMYYFDGLSYKEIASIMESTTSTVSTNIMRARDIIREKIEKRLDSDDDFFANSSKMAALPILTSVLDADANTIFSPDVLGKFLEGSINPISHMDFNPTKVVKSKFLTEVVSSLAVVAVGTSLITVGVTSMDKQDPPVQQVQAEEVTKEVEKEKDPVDKEPKKAKETTIPEEEPPLAPSPVEEPEPENTYVPLANEGEIVFAGEDCKCGHVNPKSSSVSNIELDSPKYEWEITKVGGTRVIYKGTGKSITKKFLALYNQKKDGDYTLSYTCRDKNDNEVNVKRDFKIDTGEIYENQYER